MNKIVNLFVFVMIVLCVGCTKEAAVTTGDIQGIVTESGNGNASLAGVSVNILPEIASETTGSNGHYSFHDLEAGSYKLQFTKQGFETDIKTVSVIAGQIANCDMQLVAERTKIELGATSLNFGKTNTSLSFDIINKGTSKFNWNISGLDKADWLEVSPASGALDGGKSCVVQVSLLRDKMKENKELTLIVNADKQSVSLKINAEVEKKSSKIELEPSALDFGTAESTLTFNVKNIGNIGKIDWNITGLDVDWVKIDPIKGTVEQGKSQAVKVTLARAMIKDHVKTTILVNADGESLPLEIQADEKKGRRIEADPEKIIFGEKDKATLTLFSYNGSTGYKLQKKENDAGWLVLSKTSGTIPQYDMANPAMKEIIELSVSREGLQAGDYQCTLVVGSDLGDMEIPVSMKVKESDKKLEVSPTRIAFGQDKNAETVTIKNVGNAGTLEWKITGEGVEWLTFSPAGGSLAMGKTVTVTVSVDRTKLTGTQHTSLTVAIPDESVQIAVSAEEKLNREFKVQPSSLAVAMNESASFTMSSLHGATPYQLLTKENAPWLSFNKTSGTVNDGVTETVHVAINREGLASGSYNCTIIVRTDLGDTEIPVSMTVAQSTEIAVPQGLYAYYKFDGNFEDATENAINGFGANSPTFTEGVGGGDSKAVKFNRSNNSSFVVPKPIIDSRKMTICFWGKDFSDGNIFYVPSSTQNQPMFSLSMNNGSLKFVVTRYDTGYQYNKLSPFTHPELTDGKWHHIALVSDFNSTTYAKITTILYVDGQAVDVITEDANPFSEAESGQASYGTGLKFIMGSTVKLSSSVTLNGTNMAVDNFRVYDTRMLSAQEIKTIYDARQ